MVDTPLWNILYSAMNLLGPVGRKALTNSGSSELDTLFPTAELAGAAYRSWLMTTRSYLSVASHPNLSDDALSRRRSRLKPLSFFERWGPRIGPPASLYFKICPAPVRDHLMRVFKSAGLNRMIGEDDLRASLKELGAMAKKYQRLLFSDHWKFFVDLDQLTDYLPAADLSSFERDIEKWVTGDIKHTVAGSEHLFLSRFLEGVELFFEQAPRRLENYHPLTTAEFASDPGYWARTGTSDGPRLPVNVGGTTRNARRSKWATAIAMSPADVQAALWTWEVQSNHAIQKREKTKVRAIGAGDNALYLKMIYVASFLYAACAGHPRTTLFQSAEQIADLFTSMAEDAADTNLTKSPLDQSEFDHWVVIRMLLIIIMVTKRFCKMFAPGAMAVELCAILDRIAFGIKGGTIRVGRRTFIITKGILSGWGWTSFFGTVCNFGETHVARTIVRDRTGVWPSVPGRDVYQGDDVREISISPAGAAGMVGAFNEMTFLVNPKKNFISLDVDEYLRQVATAGVTTGYPARAVASLVWRNPVSREAPRGELRVRELVSGWMQAFNRTGHWGRAVLNLMIDDVAASNHMPREVVKAICYTPASVGGMGIPPSPEDQHLPWTVIEPTIVTREFKLLRTPPAAVSLGTRWGVSPEALGEKWLGNVDPPAKTPITYELGRVKEVRREISIMGGSIAAGDGASLHARLDPSIPPSVGPLLIEEYLERRRYKDIRPLLITPDQQTFDTLLVKASRAVLIAWLRGRLPFSPPMVPGWSSLGVAVNYKPLARAMWLWCLGRHRFGMDTVVRAALKAEYAVHDVVARLPVRLGG